MKQSKSAGEPSGGEPSFVQTYTCTNKQTNKQTNAHTHGQYVSQAVRALGPDISGFGFDFLRYSIMFSQIVETWCISSLEYLN